MEEDNYRTLEDDITEDDNTNDVDDLDDDVMDNDLYENIAYGVGGIVLGALATYFLKKER